MIVSFQGLARDPLLFLTGTRRLATARNDCCHNSHVLVRLAICSITSQGTSAMSSDTIFFRCLNSMTRGNKLEHVSFLETLNCYHCNQYKDTPEVTNLSGSLVRNNSLSDLEYNATRVGSLIRPAYWYDSFSAQFSPHYRKVSHLPFACRVPLLSLRCPTITWGFVGYIKGTNRTSI